MSDSKSFLVRAHSVLIYFGIAYGIALAAILVPFIQTYVVFEHNIGLTSLANFSSPEEYGLAPGKTLNLHIKSTDNTSLGAWFVLSDQYYHSLPLPVQTPDIPTALQKRPTILYFHGSRDDRAALYRIPVYSAFSSRLDANVFVIDYRGFGDSEGNPTVNGVAADARAAWDYLIAQGAQPDDVLIVGHSLGTGVAGLLAAELARENIVPRGLVLLAPFSSVKTLMYGYNIFGVVQLLKPLVIVPTLARFFNWMLIHPFDTLSLISEFTASVLIVHAEDDWDVLPTHADALWDALLAPLLPALAPLPSSPAEFAAVDWKEAAAEQAARDAARAELVQTTSVSAFGKLEEAVVAGGRRLAQLRTHKGKHDLGRVEGVQDVMGRMFGFI
ncbi:Alpha/Beta hydrolase protein [Mycena crocata]|nr:Alpha/Beta hydrolase protein [Mycena crocata]